MSKSTVYRILHQLTQTGEVNAVFAPDSPERFDGTLLPHYHFVCKICGRIFDVNVPYLAKTNEAVHLTYGFQVDGHIMVFQGICADCQPEKEVAIQGAKTAQDFNEN